MDAWGDIASMVSASYYLGGRRGRRSAEEIQTEITKVKKETEDRIDAAWLDRRAYCLTNAIVNIEREIPILELHLKSMDDMPEEVKKSTDWILDYQYIKNRFESYKVTLEEGNKELEEVKVKLKEYSAKKDTAELEEELKELDDVEVTDKTKDAPPLANNGEDG